MNFNELYEEAEQLRVGLVAYMKAQKVPFDATLGASVWVGVLLSLGASLAAIANVPRDQVLDLVMGTFDDFAGVSLS